MMATVEPADGAVTVSWVPYFFRFTVFFLISVSLFIYAVLGNHPWAAIVTWAILIAASIFFQRSRRHRLSEEEIRAHQKAERTGIANSSAFLVLLVLVMELVGSLFKGKIHTFSKHGRGTSAVYVDEPNLFLIVWSAHLVLASIIVAALIDAWHQEALRRTAQQDGRKSD